MNLEMLTKRVDDYCALWGPGDPDERERMLAELVTEDVRYVDPRTDVSGVRALSAHIGRVVNARPRATVARTTSLDVHHEFVRFGWHVIDGMETSLDDSIDVARFEKGSWKLAEIIGFFRQLKR